MSGTCPTCGGELDSHGRCRAKDSLDASESRLAREYERLADAVKLAADLEHDGDKKRAALRLVEELRKLAE